MVGFVLCCCRFFCLMWVCDLNGLPTEEKVETHAKAVGEADQLVCAPTTAAVDLGVESRMRDSKILSRPSAREPIDEQQVIDSLRNQFVTAEPLFFVTHVDP